MTKAEIAERLRKLGAAMNEASLESQRPAGNGAVHHAVVGCWTRELQRLVRGLEKRSASND